MQHEMKAEGARCDGDREPYQMTRNFAKRYRFDFEIGYLVRSPCKECASRDDFPQCAETCKILDRIQAVLSEAISCSRSG